MRGKSRYYKRQTGDPRLSQKKRASMLVAGVVLGSVAVVAVFFVVYQALGRSDFFQITSIRIQGCQKISKSQILEYSGVDIHTNLLALDVDKVKARVESCQWISEADIERQWPNRLEITVKERSPAAIISRDDKLYYVDSAGKVFAEAAPPEDMDYPVITGLAGTTSENADNAEALKEALKFIQYASRGNLNLPVQNISEINVGNLDDFVLFLVDHPFPIHFGSMGEGLKTKYSRLARVLAWLYRHKKLSSTKYITMGYLEEKILVGQESL